MSVRAYLLRGVVAGLVAGIVVGVVAFFLAEPTIDRAVTLESQHVAAAYQHSLQQAIQLHHGDIAAARRDVAAPPTGVFSRRTQHLGLILATAIFGLGVGGIFAIAFLLVSRRAVPRSAWHRSLALGGSLFAALYAIPFLRYPANPPGVADPATIDSRTVGYLLAIALATLWVWGAWRLALSLRHRGVTESARQVCVATMIVALVVLEHIALPDSADPVSVPAGLLWDFRLTAVATQLLLWALVAGLFGLLTERAERASPAARAAARAERQIGVTG